MRTVSGSDIALVWPSVPAMAMNRLVDAGTVLSTSKTSAEPPAYFPSMVIRNDCVAPAGRDTN